MFWSHDVTMMTQSLLRTTLHGKNEANLQTGSDTAPL